MEKVGKKLILFEKHLKNTGSGQMQVLRAFLITPPQKKKIFRNPYFLCIESLVEGQKEKMQDAEPTLLHSILHH